MNYMTNLTDILTGVERVVNTPLPIAYSIAISQITWAYVLALPFQLYKVLGWITIPGTVVAGYIILGLATIGRELEDPFGHDVREGFASRDMHRLTCAHRYRSTIFLSTCSVVS